jgi:hypothetical protein
MIELYEKDMPTLKQHQNHLADPDYLRSITKQGNYGSAPYKGFTTVSEGSNWIVKCAMKKK